MVIKYKMVVKYIVYGSPRPATFIAVEDTIKKCLSILDNILCKEILSIKINKGKFDF